MFEGVGELDEPYPGNADAYDLAGELDQEHDR
jgi:hypothetical protein